MENTNEYVTFYTASEILVTGLKSYLEADGIFVMVKNNFKSGVIAGFGGGSLNAVELKIKAKDVAKAKPILEHFLSK